MELVQEIITETAVKPVGDNLERKIRDRSAQLGVIGLGYVGLPLAVEMAQKGFRVTGIDIDGNKVESVNAGISYVLGLPNGSLLTAIDNGTIRATQSFAAVASLDTISICVPTPLRKTKEPDLSYIIAAVEAVHNHLTPGKLIILESTTYPGTTREVVLPILEKSGLKAGRDFFLAYSPKRVDPGNKAFTTRNFPKVIGGITPRCTELATLLYQQFLERTVAVSSAESAEMIKHAINSFLASSIAFMNEISRICEQVGADAKEVERGLKSEPRIGPGAYLSPGGPFAGGTLARDVVALTKIGQEQGEPLVLVPAIKLSNDQHKLWAIQKLREELGELSRKRVAILGLTYKPGTDTLRRSLAIELCRELLKAGAKVRAYDPIVAALPDELANITLSRKLEEVVADCDAVVVCTEWPQIREANWDDVLAKTKDLLFIDANGFLGTSLGNRAGVTYRQVGRPK